MSDKYEPTGIFATPEQAANVTAAFNLDYRTPIMAVGIGHKLVGAPEEFRDMANRYAVESGLAEGFYAIDPNTREFYRITDSPAGEEGHS